LTDDDGRLIGLFTDSDLARLFEQHADAAFDRPIREVMTPTPLMVAVGTRLTDAMDILRNRKISELPVVDAAGKPVGLIDITDLIGLVSREEAETYLRAAG
jgi:arabinose-5-phosphate isomerase